MVEGHVVDDVADCMDVGGGETARFRGSWGKQGGWGRACGCSEGSDSFRDGGFLTISGDDSATIVSDMARVVGLLGGSGFATGLRGANWGWLGRLVRVIARHLGLWGRGGLSIE